MELGCMKSGNFQYATAGTSWLDPRHISDYDNAVYESNSTLTLAYADHVAQPIIQTSACTFTLPTIGTSGEIAIPLAQIWWIVNGAPDGTPMTISPAAGDKFLWNAAGAPGSDGLDIINTAAHAKQGDYVKITYGDGTGYSILEMGGIWEDETPPA